MTCTTYQANCSTVDDGGQKPRSPVGGNFARLIAGLGERLFHYRYVRAGLIERTLERQDNDRGAGR